MKSNYKMGIDIGSTTIKVVVIDEKNEIIYEEYRRHLSNIKVTIVNLLKETYQKLGRFRNPSLCYRFRRADDLPMAGHPLRSGSGGQYPGRGSGYS